MFTSAFTSFHLIHHQELFDKNHSIAECKLKILKNLSFSFLIPKGLHLVLSITIGLIRPSPTCNIRPKLNLVLHGTVFLSGILVLLKP